MIFLCFKALIIFQSKTSNGNIEVNQPMNELTQNEEHTAAVASTEQFLLQ